MPSLAFARSPRAQFGAGSTEAQRRQQASLEATLLIWPLSLSWGRASQGWSGLRLSSAALSLHAHNCMAVTPHPRAQLCTFLLGLLWGEMGQGRQAQLGGSGKMSSLTP